MKKMNWSLLAKAILGCEALALIPAIVVGFYHAFLAVLSFEDYLNMKDGLFVSAPQLEFIEAVDCFWTYFTDAMPIYLVTAMVALAIGIVIATHISRKQAE